MTAISQFIRAHADNIALFVSATVGIVIATIATCGVL